MGLLLFAMDGLMSRLCLEYLLEASVNIKGIALPTTSAITNKPIKVVQEHSIEWLANKHHIPVFNITDKDEKSYQDTLLATNPELILVACFPYRLPEKIHKAPEYGSYNIHPSLLPAYRGPVPLFWQFHDGVRNMGVSIHRIENDFDSGEIILQSSVAIPDGVNTLTAIQLIINSIKYSLAETIENIFNHKLKQWKQNDNKSSYFSWPKPENFHIDTSWDVQRVFNFMKGTSHWNQLYRVTINNKQYLLKDAISFEKKTCQITAPIRRNDRYEIPFSNGILNVSHLIE